MKKLLLVALAAALPSLVAVNVYAQDAASAPKTAKEERKAARVKRQTEMKAAVKNGEIKDPALAGNEVKPAPGAASSAERKAARKKQREDMASSTKKAPVPNPDVAPK